MTEDHDCTIRELVDGVARRPEQELSVTLTDSDTGVTLHPQLASSPESLERAVAAADAAHRSGVWTELSVADRASALRRLRSELHSRVPDLARADGVDTGVPRSTLTAFLEAVLGLVEVGAAELEAGFGHDVLESSAGACDQWRLPWGPAAVFLPWNAPSNLAIVKTSYALTAGCPVILKASEWAPHFSGPVADAVQAALPSGVVQIVHGDHRVGAALVADERIAAVSYTGGVAGGTAVAEACARQLKPVDLELSGNNAAVVLPDADPAQVAEQVVTAMLTLNGQYCVAPRRLIVPADQTDTYLDAVSMALGAVTIGLTTDPDAQLGPLAHESHRRRTEEQIADFAAAGCEVRRLGTLPATGHFAAPAVIQADRAPHLTEEIFGPVLLVRGYRTPDEAITIANDHAYGLSGYVFGNDREMLRSVGRRLRAGVVRLNSAFGPPDVAGVLSMWGASGIGDIGPEEGPRFFTGARFVG